MSLMKPTITTDNPRLLFYCMMPVESHTSKKNQKKIYKRRGGGMFIGNDKRTSEALEALVLNFTLQASKQLEGPISEPIQAIFRFHYPLTKKGNKPKRVADLSNLYQGPEDALQKAGVILDDNLIESHDGSRRIYGSPQKILEVALLTFDPDKMAADTLADQVNI